MKKIVLLMFAVVVCYSELYSQNTPWSTTDNIGIGTTTPTAKLQVQGNLEIGDGSDPVKYGMLQLYRPGNQGDNKFHLSFVRYGYSVSGMGYALNSNVLGIWHSIDNQGTPLLSLTPEQNIGIRTSCPLDALQIGDRFVFQDRGWKGILSNIAWNNSLNKNVRIVSAPVAGFFFTDKGNTAFINGGHNAAGSVVDDAFYSMVLYSSGQVGIGTSYENTSLADVNYRLFVSGGVCARKVKVDMDTWADHVFHPNYRLCPLNEVEQYIRKYHRLPEVPSAEEVKNDGLNLGDNQAVLLKKIEELTLYVIEQDKQIKKLVEENNELMELKKDVKALQAILNKQ